MSELIVVCKALCLQTLSVLWFMYLLTFTSKSYGLFPKEGSPCSLGKEAPFNESFGGKEPFI